MAEYEQTDQPDRRVGVQWWKRTLSRHLGVPRVRENFSQMQRAAGAAAAPSAPLQMLTGRAEPPSKERVQEIGEMVKVGKKIYDNERRVTMAERLVQVQEQRAGTRPPGARLDASLASVERPKTDGGSRRPVAGNSSMWWRGRRRNTAHFRRVATDDQTKEPVAKLREGLRAWTSITLEVTVINGGMSRGINNDDRSQPFFLRRGRLACFATRFALFSPSSGQTFSRTGISHRNCKTTPSLEDCTTCTTLWVLHRRGIHNRGGFVSRSFALFCGKKLSTPRSTVDAASSIGPNICAW